MFHTLIGRTLYEKRWFLAGWSLAFGVVSTLVMMFYPSFSQEGGFGTAAKSLPSQLQGLVGDPDVFRTIDGFIALQVFDMRMSLLMIIMTLVLATSLTVREEESGDLRTTMMTSLSRSRIAIEKCIAAVIVIILLNLVAICGVYVGLIALGETAPHALLWQLFGLTCLFATAAFSIPYSIGLASGSRGLTMFVGLVIALGSYLLSTFARSVEWLERWDFLSLIHYYDTAGLREGTFSMVNIWVYSILIILALVGAVILFRRRDIA